MGTSIKAQYNQSKQDMTIAVEAAAAIVLNAGDLLLWVGANIDGTHQRGDIRRGLRTCFDRLKEEGFPVKVGETVAGQVIFTPGAATSDTAFDSGLAIDPPTEDDVLVAYHRDFVGTDGAPHATELYNGIFTKMVELWIEERKAA